MAFLSDYEVLYQVPQLEDSALAVQADAKAVMEKLASQSLEDMKVGLNSAMKGIIQIEWIGTFDELVGSDGAFARLTRARFRGGEANGPIQLSEMDDFIENLREYCI